MSVSSPSLTTHLAALSTPRPYKAATEHPFLTAAGTRTLSSSLLSLYIAQDRIYAAHAYPRFIGHLLAAVPFSSSTPFGSKQDTYLGHIIDVLAGALVNVQRESKMFGDLGLDIGRWRERKATRDYTAEMARVGAQGNWEEGLIFLWAMERVYLDAWKHVRGLLGNAPAPDASDATAGVVSRLAENWTNPEFEKFVRDLADIVDSLPISPDTSAFARAEEIWARVVELEEAFWPVGGEELTSLSL